MEKREKASRHFQSLSFGEKEKKLEENSEMGKEMESMYPKSCNVHSKSLFSFIVQ